MAEATEREWALAAEVDAALLAIEGEGLSAEAHTAANRAVIAGKLAEHRARVIADLVNTTATSTMAPAGAFVQLEFMPRFEDLLAEAYEKLIAVRKERSDG